MIAYPIIGYAAGVIFFGLCYRMALEAADAALYRGTTRPRGAPVSGERLSEKLRPRQARFLCDWPSRRGEL